MRKLQLQLVFLLFIISGSLFAQKVHYKDKYYTLVNSKIFHRGHNVYAKLTVGQRDTIYMIATELYDDRGKLKEKYKKRRSRERYKLPMGYWESKNAESISSTASVADKKPEVIGNDKQIIEEISKGSVAKKVKEKSREDEKLENPGQSDNLGSVKKKEVQKEQKKSTQSVDKGKDHKEKYEKELKEQAERQQEKKEVEREEKREDRKEEIEKSKREKEASEKQRAQEKIEKEQQREERKEDREQNKEEREIKEKEREQRKAEKEQKRKEKELKAKEKAISNHKDAKKKLKKTEDKFKKLKEKGELSPNDEAEWLEKIEKLKEKVVKAEKKVD